MIVTTDQAVDILREGGIIIFPTDTAFGMGCRIDNHVSVKKLFSIRQRPLNKATPVLVNSQEMVEEYVEDIPKKVKDELMVQYWPGALTIILNAKVEKIPEEVRGQGATVGMRIPNHAIPLTIIEKLGVPIIGTSANFSGQKTPYSISDVDPQLINLVDGVVEGETSAKRESTVIDCTQQPWTILRQGAVTLKV